MKDEKSGLSTYDFRLMTYDFTRHENSTQRHKDIELHGDY